MKVRVRFKPHGNNKVQRVISEDADLTEIADTRKIANIVNSTILIFFPCSSDRTVLA